jgi:hypothetical protein
VRELRRVEEEQKRAIQDRWRREEQERQVCS